MTAAALRDRVTIARLLLRRGTPSICAFREVMEAGALISYGVNVVDVFRDIAAFVDQVARGSKAGDVPMRAPLRHSRVKNDEMVRWTRFHSRWSLGSNTTHWVARSMLDSTMMNRRRTLM